MQHEQIQKSRRPVAGTRLVTSLHGHTMRVFEHDHVGDCIAAHGLYEKEDVGFLCALLRQIDRPVVLDVGANVGNHTLAFATVAEEVHAFEPLPPVHALLAENVAANGLDHVFAHQVALSDEGGTGTIYVGSSDNCGTSSFDERSQDLTPLEVRKAVGDSMVAELDLKRVDLVKIDVEAHEFFVVRGLKQTIDRFRPFVTMEWDDPATIERFSGSGELAWLQSLYEIVVLGKNRDRLLWRGKFLGRLRRQWSRMTSQRRIVLYGFQPEMRYKNLLFIPKDKRELVDRAVLAGA